MSWISTVAVLHFAFSGYHIECYRMLEIGEGARIAQSRHGEVQFAKPEALSKKKQNTSGSEEGKEWSKLREEEKEEYLQVITQVTSS